MAKKRKRKASGDTWPVVMYVQNGTTECPRCRKVRPKLESRDMRTAVYCTRAPIRYMQCYLCSDELGYNFCFTALLASERDALEKRRALERLTELHSDVKSSLARFNFHKSRAKAETAELTRARKAHERALENLRQFEAEMQAAEESGDET